MDSLVETPSANYLFQVRENGGDISTQQQDIYSTLVEKILFVRFL